MSLSIQAGFGSLFTLGIGAGDLAVIAKLGYQVGRWLTEPCTDHDLFNLTAEDENQILTRTDLFDLDQLLSRWSDHISLLVNGQPCTFMANEGSAGPPPLTKLTATMVFVTAAMDEFMHHSTMTKVLLQLLRKLFHDTPHIEEIVNSQIQQRIRFWRSVASIRQLSMFIRQNRSELIMQRNAMSGLMPCGDFLEVVEFLDWLLTDPSESYTTSSSDVAGVATCLSLAGFSGLGIRGFGKERPGTCFLVYTEDTFLHRAPSTCIIMQKVERRESNVVISLASIDDTFSSLPIEPNMAALCRCAWRSGAKVASMTQCSLVAARRDSRLLNINTLASELTEDRKYEFSDADDTQICPGRYWISVLAHPFFYRVTPHLLTELEAILEDVDDRTLQWLQMELSDRNSPPISSSVMTDGTKIDAFTLFQAFFMGYHYSLLLQIVDTSGLTSPVIEGSWGYRSKELMLYIRDRCVDMRNGKISCESILCIAFALFSGERKHKSPGIAPAAQHCLGLVGKRTLLINSLVRDSNDPSDMAKLRLFDVDTSGIPTDPDGIARSGTPSPLNAKNLDSTFPGSIHDGSAPGKDWTKHIIPSSPSDHNSLLLCFRHQGRLIGAVNPALADAFLCRFHDWSLQEIFTALGRTLDDIDLPAALSDAELEQLEKLPSARYAILGFLATRYAMTL